MNVYYYSMKKLDDSIFFNAFRNARKKKGKLLQLKIVLINSRESTQLYLSILTEFRED